MEKFVIEAIAQGFNASGYPGAFTPCIDTLIRGLLYGKVLHLFSGSSLIGDERIDIEHPNATRQCDVKQFIASDSRDWDWTVLDPPYNITRVGEKLRGYGLAGCIASDVVFRRNLKIYFQQHTQNVLWLDICAPMIKGFRRRKLWLVLPGGFHTVRVLSWLERVMKPLLPRGDKA